MYRREAEAESGKERVAFTEAHLHHFGRVLKKGEFFQNFLKIKKWRKLSEKRTKQRFFKKN
jgi:hypothetical protein